MRRIATWILVGAVAALGVAAAVDATRGSERRGPQAEVLGGPAGVAAGKKPRQEPETQPLAGRVEQQKRAGIFRETLHERLCVD